MLHKTASFWSVLFICVLSAALACLASRQTMSSSRPRSSCTSHGVMGPVSMPTLASRPACPLTIRSICAGSAAHWPRHSRRPVSSTTQIAVSFCDTSKPTNRAIEPPPMVQRPGKPPGSRRHGRPMPPPRLPDVLPINAQSSSTGDETRQPFDAQGWLRMLARLRRTADLKLKVTMPFRVLANSRPKRKPHSRMLSQDTTTPRAARSSSTSRRLRLKQ